MIKLATAQIGKCGELLVQLKLLKNGIESAVLTTDTGIDLVAYSPKKKDAITIQVKANEKAKPAGGKGKLALDWWIDVNSPADLIAFVDLAEYRVWLMRLTEAATIAQQHTSDSHHFCIYTDVAYKGKYKPVADYEGYLLENRLKSFFYDTAP